VGNAVLRSDPISQYFAPAKGLGEGLLNEADCPPGRDPVRRRVLYEGQPLPQFNQVDEGAAVDALVTNPSGPRSGWIPP
jgi:hypothetical protein